MTREKITKKSKHNNMINVLNPSLLIIHKKRRVNPFVHPTPVVAHQVLQVLPVHQAAVQAHHQVAQVHRQAVPAQAGIITFRKWSILES